MDTDNNNNQNNVPENESLGRDKAYYENMYNDLPKEVVDILMKTHPLRNDAGEETAAPVYPRRERSTSKKRSRPRIQDPFEMEIAPLPEEPAAEENTAAMENPQEDMVAAVVPDAEQMSDTERKPVEDEALEEDHAGKEELARLVRKKPVKNSGSERSFAQNMTRNIESLQTTVQEARKAVVVTDIHEEDVKAMETLSREEAMDAFFNRDDGDEDDYEDERSPVRPAFVVGIVVVLAVFLFLGYRTVSLSSQLKKAESSVTELETLRAENEQLKMDKLSLEDELATLKSGDGAETQPPEGETPADTPAQPEAPAATQDSYTVQAGDTLGGISRKVYGDFAKYKLIAEANGLSENANLSIGQVLKIPKQ